MYSIGTINLLLFIAYADFAEIQTFSLKISLRFLDAGLSFVFPTASIVATMLITTAPTATPTSAATESKHRTLNGERIGLY